MPKNKSLHGLSTLLVSSLFVSSLLSGCASDDEDDNIWTSTEAIYSAKNISDSLAVINNSGNITLVWQEQENENEQVPMPDPVVRVRGDAALDSAHQFSGTTAAIDSHINIHAHKTLYQRTLTKARIYDSGTESWSEVKELSKGFWEKIKSGVLAVGDAQDDTKIVFNENINGIFSSKIALANNSNGDAMTAWLQLAESSTATGDAGLGYVLFVSQYNASTSTWSTATALSTTKTFVESSTIGAGSTTATISANADAIVSNELVISLNDNNVAQLLWVGKFIPEKFSFSANTITPAVNTETAADISTALFTVKEALNTDIDNNSNGVANLYQYTFDGSNWSSTFTMISDGTGSVDQVGLVSRNQTSGIALWTQNNTLAQSSAQTQLNLYSNWFNASAWHTTPTIVNNALGEVVDFSTASNDSGVIWASWAQTNDTYPSGASLLNKNYFVDQVSTIWANQFSGDIDSDLTLGVWGSATNIQPDTATTTLDESKISSNDTSIAVDASGDVVVAWVEKGDGAASPKNRSDSLIRANRFTNGGWLAESIIISDSNYFAAKQPIEKTVPNDHVSPKVVSTGIDQFTIGWQYWSTSTKQSGYQLYSRDYNSGQNSAGQTQLVFTGVSPIVQQMNLFNVNGVAALLWSQEDSSGINLTKSIK